MPLLPFSIRKRFRQKSAVLMNIFSEILLFFPEKRLDKYIFFMYILTMFVINSNSVSLQNSFCRRKLNDVRIGKK